MAETAGGRIKAYAAVMRPGQWVKNGFVLAPLLFARLYHDPAMCGRALLALASFCAMSSAIYAVNDWCDRGADREHPVKKFRPMARGAMNGTEAAGLIAMLAALSLAAGWTLGSRFLTVVLLYAIINVIYSLGLKHWVILDVMAIAGGFVLRILGGSAAIGAAPSHWLVLCTIMISMFLGFTKRRAELAGRGENGPPESRAVLKDYSVAFLDQAIAMVTGATIICYALYTVDARTLHEFGTRALLLTVPCVMYGMFRYVYLIYHMREGEDPTRALLRDVPTLINLGLWVVISVLVVNYGRGFELFR
jgi:4-hydroxybenzoate polyprenyltransferase